MVNPLGPAEEPLDDFAESRQMQDGSVALSQAQDQVVPSMPAVEVIEVNDDAAWALWEDSVSFQDSQFSAEAMFASTLPTPLEPPDGPVEFMDPYALVHKKSS